MCYLAVLLQGFWLYSFITTQHTKISYAGHGVSDLWDLISWLLAGVPYIAIPAAAIHSCMLHEGSCDEVRVISLARLDSISNKLDTSCILHEESCDEVRVIPLSSCYVCLISSLY